MLRPIVIFSILLISLNSYAILDFVSKHAEDAAKAVLYTDAITDLTHEISPDTELENTIKESKNQTSKYSQDAQNLYYIGEEARNILNGPDVAGANLATNIKASANYINRLKSVGLKVMALGTDGFTALNTLQTNETLEQIRKNQAAEIALTQRYTQSKAKKEALEDSKMRSFIIEQRAARKAIVSQAK